MTTSFFLDKCQGPELLLISPKVNLFITIYFVKGSGTKATIQFIKNPTPNKAQRTVKVINTNDIKREVRKSCKNGVERDGCG